jgi:DNA-binding PadR family transcriptional regulator
MGRDVTRDPSELLPLHSLEFRILLVLLDGPAHGYRIVKEIEESATAPARIHPANLYRRLRDLVRKGVLEECERPIGEEEDPARPRTYFRPTRLGREVARQEALRLRQLVADPRARRLLKSSS